MKNRNLQIAVIAGACIITFVLRMRMTSLPLDSMIALALLCGAVIRHPLAMLIPLTVRLLTDIALHQTGYGFYSSMPFDYAAYLIIAGTAWVVPVRQYVATMTAGSLLGPALFFAVSNFGVWCMWPEGYPQSMAGLMSCYAAAIPFLKASLLGNFAFSLVFLAAWHMVGNPAPDTEFVAVPSAER